MSLSGTATPAEPAVTLSADSIKFGTTAVGAANTAPAFTLTNSGYAALELTGIRITGTNASSFSEATTCAKSLAVDAHCTITVTFKPKASGALTAAVTFTDNAPHSPQEVSLAHVCHGSV